MDILNLFQAVELREPELFVTTNASNAAFPLQDLARLSTIWLGLGRPGSLYAAFPLQFTNWGSNYSNAV